MNEKDNRWMHIWITERKLGKRILDSKTDVILQFMYLNDIIKEQPYSHLNGCYKPRTIRNVSSPSVSKDASISVVIKGFVEDPHNTNEFHIFRDIYIRLESTEIEDVEKWQYCIASFFSFLFSCQIYSGMRFNMEDDWKGIERTYSPHGRTGSLEEIERASRDYSRYFSVITPTLSDMIFSWSNYFFSHKAVSIGIRKYLETVYHQSRLVVDQQIAMVCEAFEQCGNGQNPEKSMKEWALQLIGSIPSIDKSLLDEISDDAIRYYQNFKHFHVGRKWDRESISDEKVVAQSFFLKKFFQLKILYIVLEDNFEAFEKLYPGLVEGENNVIERGYGSKVFT